MAEGSIEFLLTANDAPLQAAFQRSRQIAEQVSAGISASIGRIGGNANQAGISIVSLTIKLNSLRAELELVGSNTRRFRELQQEVARTQRELGRLNGDGTSGLFDGIGASIRGFAALTGVVGIGALTQQIAATGIASEQSKIQLEALAGAYGEAEEAAAAAARIQKLLGVSSLEARSGFAQLFAALRGTGIGLKELEVLFVGVSNAARLSGAGTQEAQAAILQLRQGLAAGALQGDELRSVLEQLPAFAQAIAKEIGVNVGQLRKLGSEGKITSDIVFNAAKRLATAAVPGRASIEQIGIAFTNAKEAAAEAFGPALVGIIKTATVGIQAFSGFIQENKGQLISLGQSVVNLGKALLPLVIGIQAVRTAMGAWALASKAVAAAQAAVLALSGPKGLVLLAAGAAAAGLAVVGINKALEGVEKAGKAALGEASAAAEEFKAILQGAKLGPSGNTVSPQAISAANQLTQASLTRLNAVQRTIGLEGEALQIAQQQLAVEEAKAIERQKFNAFNDAFRQANGDSNSDAVIKAAAEYEDAANNVRSALISGAFAVRDSLKQATDNLNGALRGAFDILTFPEQQKLLEQARRNIQEAAKIGKVDPSKINFNDANAILRAGQQSKAIVDAFKQVGDAQKQANSFQQANTEALQKLAEKDWAVFVTVNADGGSFVDDNPLPRAIQ